MINCIHSWSAQQAWWTSRAQRHIELEDQDESSDTDYDSEDPSAMDCDSEGPSDMDCDSEGPSDMDCDSEGPSDMDCDSQEGHGLEEPLVGAAAGPLPPSQADLPQLILFVITLYVLRAWQMDASRRQWDSELVISSD